MTLRLAPFYNPSECNLNISNGYRVRDGKRKKKKQKKKKKKKSQYLRRIPAKGKRRELSSMYITHHLTYSLILPSMIINISNSFRVRNRKTKKSRYKIRISKKKRKKKTQQAELSFLYVTLRFAHSITIPSIIRIF